MEVLAARRGNLLLDRFTSFGLFWSMEDFEVSSLAWRDIDYRCAVCSFQTLESDLFWRIVALPCFISTGQANINSLHVGCQPSMNQFTAQRNMVWKGPVSNGARSIDSSRSRSLLGSSAQWQSKKKVLDNNTIKPKELSSKSSCGNSCSSSFALMSSDSNAISDVPIGGAKMNRYGNKNPRKKAKKKGNKCKEIFCHFVSAETVVLSEDSARGSLVSEACGSKDRDHGDESVLGLTVQEIFLPDIMANKNDFEGKFERIIQSPETSRSISSEIVEGGASEIQPCAVQNFNGNCSMRASENQPLVKMLGCAHFDAGVDLRERLSAGCCNDVCSKDFSLRSNSSDSSSFVLNSDDAGLNLKFIESESFGIDLLEEQSSLSREGFLSHHNSVKDEVDVNAEIEKAKHGIQGCTDSDTRLVLSGKKTRLKKIVTRSSRINRFGGVGTLQGRTGKENNHTVWQKVQQNSSSGCRAQLGKANPVCKQFKGTCSPVGVQMPKVKDRKAGNRKQLKDKFSRRLKRKNTSEQDNIYRSSKSCSGNSISARICKQPNEMLDISSMRYARKRLSSISRSHFQNDFADHCTTSESFHSTQVCLDGLKPIEVNSNGLNNQSVENDFSSSPRSCNSLNQSNLLKVQSPIYLPHVFFHSINQVTKGSSLAEHSKHNNHSRLTLQTWVPSGAEKSRLTTFPRPDCSSLEYADKQSAERRTSKKSTHGSVISISHDPVPVVIEGGLSSRDANYGPSEDEYEVQKTCSQDATILQDNSCELDMAEHYNCKSPCEDAYNMDAERIGQAVNDVCRAQLASEAVEMETGCPIAEFERFLHLSSPVISQKPKLRSCQMCSRNLHGNMILCSHETPNISLGCLWQWYEKHGSYGLEIKFEGHRNSKRLLSDNSAFRAYFVPFLSAVQLFKSRKSHPGTIANPVVLDSCIRNSKIKEPSDCHLPIFSLLFPKPRTNDASILRGSSQLCSSEQPLASEKRKISEQSIDVESSGESDLVFEYFELEQPQQRRPLFDKIQQLVTGNGRPQGKIYGDPTVLNSITLNDLHAGSWYSVAWYPIYRIPDGNFRAAFLTYHSLGHFVIRTSQSNSPDAGSCMVSPVVGLQSYNAQNECWFQPRNFMSALSSGLNPLGILDKRLRTLEETASLMARAVVKKGNLNCENTHPDYEFFLSRRR